MTEQLPGPAGASDRSLVETKLRGLRVLVVEDSFLLANMLSRMLAETGCAVVGPVSSVRNALAIIESGQCDAGVLDINLGAESSEPVAATLSRHGLPFFFVTGYSSPGLLSPAFSAVETVRKPISQVTLRTALARLVAG